MLLIEVLKLLASSSVLRLCGSALFKFLLSAICPIYFLSRSTHLHNVSVFITSRWLTKQLELISLCVSYKQSENVTLLIFSFGWVRSAGKWLRASQLSTTWVCSSVPVTMFPTALRAAVCMWRGSMFDDDTYKEDFFRNTQYACSTKKKLRQISLEFNSKSS